VELLADRVAIIEKGRLLACDAPAALKRYTNSETMEDVFLRITGRPSPDAAPGDSVIHPESAPT